MATCRVGDLAVAISAQLRGNLGRIVRIVGPYDGKGICVFTNQGQVWTVKCDQPMTWQVGKKRFRRKSGPVPDNRLQPIRGLTPGRQVHQTVGLGSAPGKKLKAKRSAEAVHE